MSCVKIHQLIVVHLLLYRWEFSGRLFFSNVPNEKALGRYRFPFENIPTLVQYTLRNTSVVPTFSRHNSCTALFEVC